MRNGVNQNQTSFPVILTPHDAVAFLSQVRCHKCGGSLYKDCTAPKDQGRIAANKKIISKAQKLAKKESKDSKDSKSTTSRSKCPPRPGHGENNCHTIDGKEYFYHFKKGSGCWLIQITPVQIPTPKQMWPMALTTLSMPNQLKAMECLLLLMILR
jgi:hypothetical protein